ncbi:MAG: hypothetical protein HC822_22540 [Oscillochloris sp.]|nr:hypothetical protein [Oscillochloris sp.]
MSYQSAIIALRFVFFFALLLVMYMVYESGFSLDAIMGVLLGMFIGIGFNLLEDRKTEQSPGWVMWGPFLGIAILGVVRLFANQEVLLLVGIAGGSAFLTILGNGPVFNTKTSDLSDIPQDHAQQRHRENEDWQNRRKQLHREEEQWRAEQRRRRQR